MSSEPSSTALTVVPAAPFVSNGRLSLGATATSTPVSVRLGVDGLDILESADGAARHWPYALLEPSEPLRRGLDDVVLTSRGEPGATLFVSDQALIAGLAARARRLGASSHRLRWLIPGLVIGGLAMLAAGLLYAFNISPAKSLAQLIPEKARASLGDTVLSSITQQHPVCTDSAGTAVLDRLVSRLAEGDSRVKAFHIKVVNWRLLNAFTLPGGNIILTRDIVEKTRGPDELAGVLAHEMGHAIERHPEAALIRALGLSAAAEIILGGQGGSVAQYGIALTQLSYSREAEREADNHAFRILKGARISPKGIAEFFKRMAVFTKEEKSSGYGDIFMTHPASADRAKLAEAQTAYQAEPALSDADWKTLQSICGPRPQPAAAPKKPAPAPSTAPSPSRPPSPSTSSTSSTASDDKSPEMVVNGAGAGDATAFEVPAAAKPGQRRMIDDATAVIAAEPDRASAYQYRAELLMTFKFAAAAIPDWDQVVRLDPKSAVGFYGRARANEALKKWTEADADYAEAARRDTETPTYHGRRAYVLNSMGRYQEAKSELDTALAISPESVWFGNRGFSERMLNDDTAAVEDYSRAITLVPDRALYFVGRAISEERLKRKDDAIADFRAALSLSPTRHDDNASQQSVARDHLKKLGIDVGPAGASSSPPAGGSVAPSPPPPPLPVPGEKPHP